MLRTYGTLEAVGLVTTALLLFAHGCANDPVGPARGRSYPPRWEWLNPLPQGNHLNSASFVNAELGFIGGWSTLLRTKDGGISWASVTIPDGVPVVDLEFWTPSSGLLLTPTAVLRTDDSGSSWYSSNLDHGVHYESMAFRDGLVGVAVGRDGPVVRTDDGGFTWSVVATDDFASLFEVCFADKEVAVAVGSAGTVLRSTDAGNSWNSIPTGVANQLVGVRFFGPERGFAVGTGGMILRSSDAGASWRVVSQEGPYLADIVLFENGSGTAIGAFGMSLRTQDGGDSWTPAEHANWSHDKVVRLAHDAALSVGQFGAIARTTNSGESWIWNEPLLDEFLLKVQILGSESLRIMSESEFHLSDDGGKTFRSVQISPNEVIRDFEFATTNVGLAVGSSESIFRSTDGGETWSTVHSGVDATLLREIAMIDEQSALVLGTSGVILRTTNSGESWERLSDIQDVGAASFSGDGVGMAFLPIESALRTQDAGTTWEEIFVRSGFRASASVFVSRNTVIAVGEKEIVRSVDAGRTWDCVHIAPDSPFGDFSCVAFANRRDGIAIAADGTSAWTDDGGQTWHDDFQAAYGSMRSIALDPDGRGFAVGYRGTVFEITIGRFFH